MLPIIKAPTYELILPLSKQKIKFRPFTVKEQQILLMAKENDDKTFIMDNIKQIIKNCCITEINVDTLSLVDIEYFFLQLRARSVGEEIEAKYKCLNKLENGEICNNKLRVNINLLQISIEGSAETDIIELTPSIGIKLRYPDYSVAEKLKNSQNFVEVTFDFIISCLDYIYDQDNVYQTKDYSKKELYEFLESLTLNQFKKIEEFFKNVPKIYKKVDVVCDKCGFQHKLTFEGLDDFFE